MHHIASYRFLVTYISVSANSGPSMGKAGVLLTAVCSEWQQLEVVTPALPIALCGHRLQNLS